MIQNNSKGKDNWSQRMNPDDPSTPWNEMLETCNVTAFITAAITAGYDMQKCSRGLHIRPPMDLLYFMRQDKDCIALYGKIDPAKNNPMNEYMEILALAGGKYLRIDKPLTAQYELKFDNIILSVLKGDGIVLHGEYEFKWASGKVTKGGHFQSMAGFNYHLEGKDGVRFDGNAINTQLVLKLLTTTSPYHAVIESVILDDPFGNPNTGYIDTAGNDVVVPYSKFVIQVKPLNKFGKDAIIIPKATA